MINNFEILQEQTQSIIRYFENSNITESFEYIKTLQNISKLLIAFDLLLTTTQIKTSP